MESCFDTQMTSLGSVEVSLMEMGFGHFGCSHYRRRCKIRAPCCDEIFDCRHCHNESKNSLEVDPLNRHDIPRHDLKTVICSLCNTEQDVQQKCIHCGVCMGKYYCSKCKFFDDDVSKNQYHCDKCGICRTGGEENFFHCNKCGCCYSRLLKDSHICVERAMHHNCPVCFEVNLNDTEDLNKYVKLLCFMVATFFHFCLQYLFDTTKDITVLPCGHTIHLECVKEMAQHFQYSCPVCSKSYCDMSCVWQKLDQEVSSTPMPQVYKNKMVWILCNDCGETSEVNFHIVAHKCLKCNSYNTRQTRGGPASCSSRIGEMVR
ncbi:hypothetical protein F0562_016160 [Nyssa sinensis]|uniref:RING-type domain-containing protein n=1 Tax=Nyssa sinensis TaxID=561372 RepID=A0A5J4ZLZ5_9ASTE|nr:hypothetical protein F0562_016160 [Nyssa sinensis]